MEGGCSLKLKKKEKETKGRVKHSHTSSSSLTGCDLTPSSLKATPRWRTVAVKERDREAGRQGEVMGEKAETPGHIISRKVIMRCVFSHLSKIYLSSYDFTKEDVNIFS